MRLLGHYLDSYISLHLPFIWIKLYLIGKYSDFLRKQSSIHGH